MQEKKFNYGLIIFLVVLVILFIPIISDYIKNQNIITLSSEEITEKINNKESFIVYVGDLSKNQKKELRNIRDITKGTYSYDYNVYNSKESKTIKKMFGENIEVAVVIEGDIQKTYAKYDNKILEKDTNTYLLANITSDNRFYKVAKDFKDYKSIIKSDNVVMSVFGRESCSFCKKFEAVYNPVAEKYDVDIYYFDSDNYDSKEYSRIVNLDLTVPSKCSSTGKDFKLSEGFGTPLTIFTKDGEVIDCIGGYISRNDLIEKLKIVNMISE